MKIPEFQYLFNELRNWLAENGLAGNELIYAYFLSGLLPLFYSYLLPFL